MCKWNDNSIMTITSNYETHLPLQEATHYVKGTSKTKLQQRILYQIFYKGMGGVDLMDRLLAKY